MEAIGQLAGGIAHDFNNLLTAITGYGELSLKYVTEDGPLRRHLLEIQKAGGRAASLTRQLLAFSRKQLLQPKPLNLNRVVSEMERMFHRLIGENIELRTALAADLRTIIADVSQIEQVILNLIVNARDAMPMGGRLVIETANLTLAKEIVNVRFSIPPGDYVMLAVSDTGQGMSEETQEKIFEPFFSTKEQGKGTGLGLSTVYGIVKQSGGYIRVESEIGRGASFEIILPCAVEGDVAEAAMQPASPRRGTETLLLVEDEELVRKLTCEILELGGYRVLEARHGTEALSVSWSHAGPIDLLLTDMVMPGMTGRELAAEISAGRPHIKIIFMSGYTESGILNAGEKPPGVWFLEKPFTPDGLLRRVREALEDAQTAG
jgi:CheY-like chemotaxis protein